MLSKPLNYVLNNDVFKFNNNDVFLQIDGRAMATKLVPALATIYIGDLEEAFLQERQVKRSVWARYVDDVFMIWPYTTEQLDCFLADLHKLKQKSDLLQK